MLLTFSLYLFEARLESLDTRVKVRLGTLKFRLCTFVLGFRRIESAPGCAEIIFGTLECGLRYFVSGASWPNFFDQTTTIRYVTLGLLLVTTALSRITTSRSTVASIICQRCRIIRTLHILKRGLLLCIQWINARTVRVADTLVVLPRSILFLICTLFGFVSTIHRITRRRSFLPGTLLRPVGVLLALER